MPLEASWGLHPGEASQALRTDRQGQVVLLWPEPPYLWGQKIPEALGETQLQDLAQQHRVSYQGPSGHKVRRAHSPSQPPHQVSREAHSWEAGVWVPGRPFPALPT